VKKRRDIRLSSAPRGEDERAVARQLGSRRLGDLLGLLDKRSGRGQLTGVVVEPRPRAQGKRQNGQSAGLTRMPDQARAEHLPALVVHRSCAARVASQSQRNGSARCISSLRSASKARVTSGAPAA